MTLILAAAGCLVLIGCALIGTPVYAFCRYMAAIERDEQIEAAEYMQADALAADEWRRAA